MKILMVNKFFYVKGGSETYYFALKELLEKNGHHVIDFSMKDNKNLLSRYSEYFVENIDYNSKSSIINKIKMGIKLIYSLEAKKKIEKLINDTKPDIAHLHLFQHQISPSILDVLKKYNIPIIYTAHDLSMICPNYKMLSNGEICEACKGGKFIECTKRKCVKNSYIKSFISSVEGYFYKYKGSYDLIDYIITPSKFYKNKFIEFGVESEKIEHIPNFLESGIVNIEKVQDRDYLLYFGRLSEEKGIFTLIKSMNNIDCNLYIVGTGPLKNKVKEYISMNNLNNIQLLGFKTGKELYSIIGNAKAVILPSEWYENGPYSAIESLKLGKPIIGSNIGGIPELIYGNGYTFKQGNEKDLTNILNKFINLEDYDIKKMENESINIFKKYYTEKTHYREIIGIYEKTLKKYI